MDSTSQTLLSVLTLALLLLDFREVSAISEREKSLITESFVKSLEMERVPKPRKGRTIEIPDFLREQYMQQTGLEVDTTHFRKPGGLTGYSNTLVTVPGRVMNLSLSADGLSHDKSLRAQTLLDFEDFKFDPEYKFEAAYLKVYWKPRLSIKRKSGSFYCTVSDLLKWNRSKDEQFKTPLDAKKIHHRDADLDECMKSFIKMLSQMTLNFFLLA